MPRANHYVGPSRLELQSASEDRIDGFSVPSSSVLICLQSCKTSLQPLQTLAQKMQKSPNASTLSQLRSDIKLGLKTKDITFLEIRIQSEISGLSTALGVNMNSLLYAYMGKMVGCSGRLFRLTGRSVFSAGFG